MRAYLLIVISLVVFASTTGAAQALTYPSGNVGQDISWPNCNNLKFNAAEFGVVGVNGGLSFRDNPCIGSEAALYKQNLSLYINTGFPGSPIDLKFMNSPLSCSANNQGCLAYNYGYNAGLYAANYALAHGVVSNNWWLDVESINSWSNYPWINRLSLAGEVQGIKDSINPTSIGYYAYPPGWKLLTGSWQNYYPSWVATNSNYKKVAATQCSGFEFNGGKTQLSQYIGKLDLDLAC